MAWGKGKRLHEFESKPSKKSKEAIKPENFQGYAINEEHVHAYDLFIFESYKLYKVHWLLSP